MNKYSVIFQLNGVRFEAIEEGEFTIEELINILDSNSIKSKNIIINEFGKQVIIPVSSIQYISIRKL